MSSLTGTGALVRFILHRDRIRILVWILAIAALVVSSAASVAGLYPTAEALAQAARLIEGNAIIEAFNGPAQGVETLGGRVAFELGAFTFMTAGLMSVFMISRLTRAEEESGRSELILSLPVGRNAPVAAALVVVTAMNIIVGVVVALGLLSQNLPATGSIAFGVAMAATGLVFAGVAALAAQVTESARVVSGLSGAAIGIAFAVRAIGDVGDGTLSWASPLGWAQKVRAFAGEQWWPLLLPLGTAVALIALAAVLINRRDLGAALVAPRPGPREAAPWLGRPLGLAWRLQRGTVLWWSIGLFFGGVSYGAVADSIEEFVADNETMREMIAGRGGDLMNSFFATTLLMLAIAAGGYAIQTTLRLRSEETALRAELMLATPFSRTTYLLSHLAIALAGSAFVVAAGGFGLGLTYGITIDDLSQAPRLTAAAVAQVPAVWVLAGVAAALFGALPRLAMLAWAGLAGVLLLGFFGDVLKLPEWLRAVSPFHHTPAVPAEPFALLPTVVLIAVTIGLIALGWGTFGRRDVA